MTLSRTLDSTWKACFEKLFPESRNYITPWPPWSENLKYSFLKQQSWTSKLWKMTNTLKIWKKLARRLKQTSPSTVLRKELIKFNIIMKKMGGTAWKPNNVVDWLEFWQTDGEELITISCRMGTYFQRPELWIRSVMRDQRNSVTRENHCRERFELLM